jgi:hypothetical protein
MKRSGPRKTVNLSDSLHKQLNRYALAASVAGVSALALAPPADAKVVYTPAHVHIRPRQQPFPLDLNHDGIIDFYILHSYSHDGGEHLLAACQHFQSYDGQFCFNTNSSNVIRATNPKSGNYEAALRYGAKIQRGDRFVTTGSEILASFCCYSGTSGSRWLGPWANGGKGVKNRYLGLKFKIKGRYHFGWARLTVTTTSDNFIATLTGYAYETIPGKAIVAGQTKSTDEIAQVNPAALTAPAPGPVSLGALALGAPGLSIWKREE